MEQQTPNRIVTLTIDMQHDFLPGGALAVKNGDEIIPTLNTLNSSLRSNGATIVFTGDQHPSSTPHFDTWPPHCIEGTYGAALDERLVVAPDDIIIRKGMGQTDGYSGFEGVSGDGLTLEQLITPNNTETVYVTLAGVATEYCVLNTGLDALKVDPGRGRIRLLLAVDAMRAINLQPGDGEKAISDMVDKGAIATTSLEILSGEAFK